MSQRTDGGFLRRIGSWIGGALAAVLLIGAAVFSIGYGGWHLWVEHTGIPAQVQLLKCDSHRRSKSSDCSAAWIQADGTKRIVTVNDVPNPVAFAFPRKPVDVHIRGNQAFMNGSSLKAVGSIVLGIVILGIWPAVALLGRLRRPRDPGASPTNDPSGHFQL